jgi:hypothetical protein
MRRVLVFLLFLAACARREPISAEIQKHRIVVPPMERPVLDARRPAMAMQQSFASHMPPPPMCEPGEVRSCGFSLWSTDGSGDDLLMHCRQAENGQWVYDREECATPLVLSFDGAPVEFTRPVDGLFAIGPFARTEWVSARTPWLALDEDGTGCVESQAELFGADGAARNGFEKLARLDGNGDGRIDARDDAFGKLLLWSDRDQNRTCTANEVVRLADTDVTAIDLAWTEKRVVGRSFEGEASTLRLRHGTGRVIDVYLSPM